MTAPRSLGAPLIRMGAVTSTMDVARRLESLGAPEGITVVAATQTHGRGRSDRVWQSPPNAGLYCSILLRPNIPIELFRPFSVATGLAICDALDPDYALGLQLKWPNDILATGKKLGGILITTSLTGAHVASAILGIGLNLEPDAYRPTTAIALAEINQRSSHPRVEILPALISSITRRYQAILDDRPEFALRDWPERLAFLDQPVSLDDGSTTHTGTLYSVDTSGALLLKTTHGIIPIVAGEITRGPQLLDS